MSSSSAASGDSFESDGEDQPGDGAAIRIRWARRVLRSSVVLLFLGNGAQALLPNEDQVPIFASLGIGRDTALVIMQLTGMLDICLALLTLVRPNRYALIWMTVWILWTASMRLVAGAPLLELLERAPNIAAPLALLILMEVFPSRAGSFARWLVGD